MGHGTDKHLEHAEHTQHHAHDPFDRRVAMSMAITAAVLAGATLMSHRGHTETLRLQAEANSIQTIAAREQTLANISHTEASDTWAFYQAQNVRSHQYQNELKKLKFVTTRPGTENEQEEARVFWETQVQKYEGPLDTATGKRSGGNLDKIKAKAEALVKKAEQYQQDAIATLKSAKGKTDESHHLHHAVDWIDFGHLAIEFALVLCSVAVLTKSRTFWALGVLVALSGGGLVGYGVYKWFFVAAAH